MNRTFELSAKKYVDSCAKAVDCTKQVAKSIMSTKHWICSNYYQEEVSIISSLATKRTLSVESISLMILNAPSIASLAYLLTHVNISGFEMKTACLEAFLQFQTSYDFSSPYLSLDEELLALATIYRTNRIDINLQESICLVLKDERCC